MGQNNTPAILINKGKSTNNIEKGEELLFITGKANGQYWEWLFSWSIEVAPSVPHKSHLDALSGSELRCRQCKQGENLQ